jgi:hypothetical protein
MCPCFSRVPGNAQKNPHGSGKFRSRSPGFLRKFGERDLHFRGISLAFQSEHEAGARHSGRAEQSHRPGRSLVPLHIKPDWVVEPFEDAGSKNTPPILKFQPQGRPFTGPPIGIATTLTAALGDPLELTAWVTDETAKLNVPTAPPRRRVRGSSGAAFLTPPPLSITWSKYRGPGTVTFANAKPAIDKADGGKTTTTATFGGPGDYVLRLQANDQSGEGGGGFQCCWSNVHVAVSVRPVATTGGER